MEEMNELAGNEQARKYSTIYVRRGIPRARGYNHNIDGEILDGILKQLVENKKEYKVHCFDHYEPTIFFQKDELVIKIVTLRRDSPEVLGIEPHVPRKEILEDFAKKFSLPLDESKVDRYLGDYRSVVQYVTY
jgi:hypothetical protein